MGIKAFHCPSSSVGSSGNAFSSGTPRIPLPRATEGDKLCFLPLLTAIGAIQLENTPYNIKNSRFGSRLSISSFLDPRMKKEASLQQGRN